MNISDNHLSLAFSMRSLVTPDVAAVTNPHRKFRHEPGSSTALSALGTKVKEAMDLQEGLVITTLVTENFVRL